MNNTLLLSWFPALEGIKDPCKELGRRESYAVLVVTLRSRRSCVRHVNCAAIHVARCGSAELTSGAVMREEKKSQLGSNSIVWYSGVAYGAALVVTLMQLFGINVFQPEARRFERATTRGFLRWKFNQQ
jgi:hypothetical protein